MSKMRFEKMSHVVIQTKGSGSQMAKAGGTVIETKVWGIWKTDGYDDKPPAV